MKAVILAGGKGTRMGSLVKDIPKPMVPVNGKPIIEYLVELLRDSGIKELIICNGYLSKVIEDYFKDGSDWGVKITYYVEETPLGTAGCVKKVAHLLKEDFLVLYGDVIVNADIHRIVDFHKKNNSQATLAVHPNDHPHDSDLVEIDDKGKIIAFHPKPHKEDEYYRNLGNACLYVLSPKVFDFIDPDKKPDFGKHIFPEMLRSGIRMYGYNTPEYLKDIGTPQRVEEVSSDVRSGKFNLMSFQHKRPAIFIDRDGVINKEVNNLKRHEDFELIPGAVEAIKSINKSKYFSIVITNQPVVAKGFCSLDDVYYIHKKMETLLGKGGAKLDGIYLCPHHPDKGFEGENPLYKIKCDCRKPSIGLIRKAVEEFNIDLDSSFFIGDSYRFDMKTAENAKVSFVGVETGVGCEDAEERPKVVKKDLKDAVDHILSLD